MQSGDYTDTDSVIPAGYLELDRTGTASVSLSMFGGGFASGLTMLFFSDGGPDVLNLFLPSPQQPNQDFNGIVKLTDTTTTSGNFPRESSSFGWLRLLKSGWMRKNIAKTCCGIG